MRTNAALLLVALSVFAAPAASADVGHSLDDVRAKVDGGKNVQRGKGLVKGFLARFKERWAKLKDASAALGQRARKAFENVRKQIRKVRTSITKKARSVQFAWLKKLRALREKARTLLVRNKVALPAAAATPSPAPSP